MIEQYVKSPLNYTGGKGKLLEQMFPLFPEHVNTFVDLFGGGCNVGLNYSASKVLYNDVLPQLVCLLNALKSVSLAETLRYYDEVIEYYDLSKDNKDGYDRLRNDYNANPNPFLIYMLIAYSFNNQIRFNSRGEFNMPFGKNRSSFNPSLRRRFCKFVEKLQSTNIEFRNDSFENVLDSMELTENDFVYVDPPYLNSAASYNENGGWTEKQERLLLDKLDILNEQRVRFALSNNLLYGNVLLEEWMKKYKVHYLDYDYSNCNYHKKEKISGQEILITNY